MRPPHLALRCDASPQIGVGHLARCAALAEEACERGWRVFLLGRVEGELPRRLLAGIPLQLVPSADRGRELADLAAGLDADVLHVDGYDEHPELLERCRERGVLLSAAVDGEFGDRSADIRVDPSWSSAPDGPDGPLEDVSGDLRGPRWAPLARRVRSARERRSRGLAGGGVPRVVVVMGGTDVAGLVPVLAGVLAAGLPGAEVVAVSPGAPVRSGDLLGSGPGLRVVPPGDALLDLAASADAVVSAAGTTTLELAAIGVPVLLVALVRNQEPGYRALVGAGLAVGLGTGAEVAAAPEAAVPAVWAVLADTRGAGARAAAAAALVDGRGCERLVDAWSARARPPGFGWAARPAVADDSQLLLAWRNDPGTRAASLSTGVVGAEEHEDWFARVLADPARQLLVVEHRGTPVATVRADALRGGGREVSLTVAPALRGRGLGVVALDTARRALPTAPAEAPAGSVGGGELLARVREENAASRALFHRAGFVLRGVDPAGGVETWCWSAS